MRRVNPFDGVLQIVEVEGGRAYSQDGRVWQIQVVAERPDHTWRSTNAITPGSQYFNFGLWDTDDGMRRIPANPLLDIGVMTAEADRVIESLERIEASLPFALSDCYECWATDRDNHPLALLATAESLDLTTRIHVRDWQATRPGDHRFISGSRHWHPQETGSDNRRRHHAERIEHCIREHTEHRCWFRRRVDGSGEPLAATQASSVRTRDEFPPLGLRHDWADPEIQGLVNDYVAWLAPRLLLLQGLPDHVRAELEPLACHRAIELDNYRRLLPRVIDAPLIEAALVEARLRRADRDRPYGRDREP